MLVIDSIEEFPLYEDVNHKYLGKEIVIVSKSKCLYDAFSDGVLIIRDSSQPALDACRYLLARGITGTLSVFGTNGSLRFVVDIDKGAKLTVKGSYFVAIEDRTPEGP